jgi:hypothetical protein
MDSVRFGTGMSEHVSRVRDGDLLGLISCNADMAGACGVRGSPVDCGALKLVFCRF